MNKFTVVLWLKGDMVHVCEVETEYGFKKAISVAMLSAQEEKNIKKSDIVEIKLTKKD